MHQCIAELLESAPVIVDGGWGTCFQKMDLPTGECPDEWNLTKPDMVRQVAASYVEAGSQIILSNTFGANRVILARHGLADKAVAINIAGAQLSLEAARDQALVFASMGPTGIMLMMGEVTEDEVFAAFCEQADALVEGGANGLVLETFTDLAEAVLAVRAAARTGLPVVANMVFDAGPELDRTMMGQTPELCAEGLLAAGADVVGSNCGKGIEAFEQVCARLHAATGAPVWMKPNAGLPEVVNGKTICRQTAEEFAAHVPALVTAGAGFIGGCCGTTPDFIRAVGANLK